MIQNNKTYSFDSRRAKEILRIPDRYGIPLMVATGYDFGAPPVVHADLLDCDEWDGEEDLQTQKPRRTPRLEMNEIFFGDTFGDLLFDNGEALNVKENAA